MWFPLCDIIHKFRSSCYDWSLYHMFWERSGLHFVIILAYIFCHFWKIDSVYVCVINVSVWEHNSSRPEMLYNSCYKNFGHFLGKHPGWNLLNWGVNACNFTNIALPQLVCSWDVSDIFRAATFNLTILAIIKSYYKAIEKKKLFVRFVRYMEAYVTSSDWLEDFHAFFFIQFSFS